MGIGVHQVFVLNALFFILVLEVLSCKFHTGVSWWPDDLMLITDTQNECISKLNAWKAGMESRGFHVNKKKTKFMVCSVDLDVLQKSSNYPCAVCCKGVCNNPIECVQVKLLVNKKCSGITGQLVNVQNYNCRRCKDESRPIDGRPMTQVDVAGTNLGVEDTFWPWIKRAIQRAPRHIPSVWLNISFIAVQLYFSLRESVWTFTCLQLA